MKVSQRSRTKNRSVKSLDERAEPARLLESCKREVQSIRVEYERLLESAPDAMLFVDGEGRIVSINARMERLFGYRAEELEGKDLDLLIPERFRTRHRHHMASYLLDPQARPMGGNLQIYALRKDNTEFPADISLSPFDTDRGMLVIASVRDISERRRNEARTERDYEVQKAISSVLKNSLEPVSLEEQMGRALDLMLAIPGLSPQARGCIYLVEDESGLLVLKTFRGSSNVPECCDRVRSGLCLCGKAAAEAKAAFTERIDERHEIRHSGDPPHGHYCIPIVSSGEALGLINIFIEEGHERSPEEESFLVAVSNTLASVIMRFRTESELNKSRAQLAEAEKFAALGRMMAHVAHEIRNPLTAIGGFARRLDKNIRKGTKEKEYAAFIVEEVRRLEGILRDVLSSSRTTSRRLEKCDLGKIVEEALRIFDETLKERSIELYTSFPGLLPVRCDRERILEVIENLMSNALDAMPHGGLLAISGEEETIDGAPYVRVWVRDTGEGIKEEDMGRIFEPFFTTKQSPKGVGLGLSIVKRFVEDHGGMVHVESKVGEGSTFTVHFLRSP
jgi:PAS domain S-box-containing protein